MNVSANNLNFRAVQCGEDTGTKGKVLLLHGFPFHKEIWLDLMGRICGDGWHAVAYDQRGYSEDHPDNVEAYHYDLLREDVFAVADTLEWDSFNLIGHDQGAMLGYHVVDSDVGKKRVQTFCAMSIPHPNVFNDALLGPNVVPQQEIQSQYFQIFTEETAASVLLPFFGRRTGSYIGFSSQQQLQKGLWWYKGASDAGVLAIPNLYTYEEALERGATGFVVPVRKAFQHLTTRPGIPATRPWGKVTMPFLYAIGTLDTAILGWQPWGLATRNYASSTYMEVLSECDHIIPPYSANPAAGNPEFETLQAKVLELLALSTKRTRRTWRTLFSRRRR